MSDGPHRPVTLAQRPSWALGVTPVVHSVHLNEGMMTCTCCCAEQFHCLNIPCAPPVHLSLTLETTDLLLSPEFCLVHNIAEQESGRGGLFPWASFP